MTPLMTYDMWQRLMARREDMLHRYRLYSFVERMKTQPQCFTTNEIRDKFYR